MVSKAANDLPSSHSDPFHPTIERMEGWRSRLGYKGSILTSLLKDGSKEEQGRGFKELEFLSIGQIL